MMSQPLRGSWRIITVRGALSGSTARFCLALLQQVAFVTPFPHPMFVLVELC